MAAPVGSIYIALSADAHKLIGDFGRAGAAVNAFGARTTVPLRRFDRAMLTVRGGTIGATAAMTRLGAVAASLGAGSLGVAGVIRFADSFTRLKNQLKLSGLEGEKLESTLSGLFAIAQKNGVAIEPLATLYGRLAQAQKELGASGQELVRFTEGVALSLRVQGSDATQAAGALLQLSQALGGAIVRAEEFNSINEGARPILQAVANGLEDAGGSVSKLRSLVVAGKVSSQAFFSSFLSGMGGLEAKAARATPTISQGFARLNNAITLAVGKLDALAGASTASGSGLAQLAAGIEGIASNEQRLRRTVELAERLVAAFIGFRVGRSLGGPLGGIAGGAAGFFEPEIRGAAEDYNDYLKRLNPRMGKGDRVAASFDERFGGPVPSAPTKPVSLADFPAEDPAGDLGKRQRQWAREGEAIREVVESLAFESDQLSRTAEQQELFNALKQAGVTLESEAGAAIAKGVTALQAKREALAKTTAAMEFLGDASKDFIGGFARDILSGVSATEALGSALDRLADKLLDLAVDGLVDVGLKGLRGGLFGAGASEISSVGAGLFHSGGVVGANDNSGRRRTLPANVVAMAPRLHSGLGSREFAAVLEKGEHVLTSRMAGRAASVMSGLASGGGGNVYVDVHNYNGSSVTTDQSKRSNGDIDIQVVVDNINARNMARQGSATNRMGRAAGLKSPLIRR